MNDFAGTTYHHFRYAKVLIVFISNTKEPLYTQFYSLFFQPSHRYRTFAYTFSPSVSPAIPPLQNLCIHILTLCFSSRPIATEPLHTYSHSLFFQPSHRYRTFAYTFSLSVSPAVSPLQNLLTAIKRTAT